MGKAGSVALWAVSIVLAAVFLFAGSFKLIHHAQAEQMFVQYGYAAWFGIFIGVCETLGGFALLIPRLAAPAAAGLSVIMVGATLTMALHHQGAKSLAPFCLLIVLVLVWRVRSKRSVSSSRAPAN